MMSPQEALAELLASLDSDKTQGYGPGPIPDAVDDLVRRLVGRIRGADPATRDELWRKLGDRHGMLCLLFAERMAALAVRTGDPEHVREGLEAATLGARAVEPRDGILRLAPLYDALMKLGRNPTPYFAAAEDLADRYFVADLQGFPFRAEADRSLASMGYVEGFDRDGFRYVQEW
ncbi:hypothetical protein [Paludisphaera mucosa]|uniref:Uncharacterized protein n=1 Tax=Paludisphaera mucosa TaxID=3030827 RepID=A0ABT6FBU3_9BACT|nr:hypothetical protein [Paludisphaera mucosa]MDG3005064.1 hypothetical protein [Paludisphaera mucosa]